MPPKKSRAATATLGQVSEKQYSALLSKCVALARRNAEAPKGDRSERQKQEAEKLVRLLAEAHSSRPRPLEAAQEKRPRPPGRRSRSPKRGTRLAP